jgi:D-arabinose 1-dehydrogenase-like Zn-dependent alcohol dehydrogenase
MEIVDCAFVSAFSASLLGRDNPLTPRRPCTPGQDAIGVIEAVSDEVSSLQAGMRVFCNPWYEPYHPTNNGPIAFLGHFAMSKAAMPLVEQWPDGAYAERIVLPASCFTPIPSSINLPDEVLCRLGWLGTAYGALRRSTFRPGQTVAILGANGMVGSSAILSALALGASKVFAIGRRAKALEPLANLDARVEIILDPADIPEVHVALVAASGDHNAVLETLLQKVQRRGSIVAISFADEPLRVSVMHLVISDITLRGSIWFDQGHLNEILALIASGVLRLNACSADTFGLDDISQAIDAAKDPRTNPLRHVALKISG